MTVQPLLGIHTHRQRSLLVSELQKLGLLRFIRKDYVSFNEICVSNQCLVCNMTIERGEIVNHFRSDELHYRICTLIIEKLKREGKIKPLVLNEIYYYDGILKRPA